MKKLVKNKIYLLSMFLLLCNGCITVQEEPFKQGLTKVEIRRAWQREPDNVSYNSNNLKYGADETWIYRYSDGTEDKYFFKKGRVIRKEHIVYGNF